MNDFETVIGLEVHAQLLTCSKMFCACRAEVSNRPNINICPVCTGQPGALPVLNKCAIEMAIKTGRALNCTINNFSEFSRKNYFYPDLPKGYQITQYEFPLCENGCLKINYEKGEKKIGIIRIHLEEDAGKLIHDQGHDQESHVDYNRSGVPLIEIVSRPDMRSPKEGVTYLKTLRSVLMYLGVCDGNMQEGSFRCDANLSVRKKGNKKFGIRTELKNLNSFKAIEKALTFEMNRQIGLVEKGGVVTQETRLWDEKSAKTVIMRTKEEAHDYRYFPEPDLDPLIIKNEWIDEIERTIPELADERAKRFVREFKIPEYDAKVLTSEKRLADYYEEVIKNYNSPKKISNWIMTELLRELGESGQDIDDCMITAADFAELIKLIESNVISGKIAKDVFLDMYKSGRNPKRIIKERNLEQVSDKSELEAIIEGILEREEENLKRYREGRTKLFGYFVGQVMKETKGKANPGLVNEILKKKL